MIFIAEFGDKTQIAVARLSTRYNAAGIWLGATHCFDSMGGTGITSTRPNPLDAALEWSSVPADWIVRSCENIANQ